MDLITRSFLNIKIFVPDIDIQRKIVKELEQKEEETDAIQKSISKKNEITKTFEKFLIQQ